LKLNAKKLFVISTVTALTACGGGGGSAVATGPVASTNTFNLKSAYVALTSAGWSKIFTISGTCTGTISIASGAINASTTFETQPALSGTSVVTTTFSNCTPATSTTTETKYTDSNYMTVGYSISGGDYAVYASPLTLPNSVKVGDSAVVGTINRYTNSTKSTSVGTQVDSFVVEADTATTAIINAISRFYDASNVLQTTEQDRYRIDANNVLTPISMDITTASGTHFIGK
jgi:hypothetical protein